MLVEVVAGEEYIIQDSRDLKEWNEYFRFVPDKAYQSLSFAPRYNDSSSYFFKIIRVEQN